MRSPIKPTPGSLEPNLQRVLENNHLILSGGINYGTVQGSGASSKSIVGHVDNFHSALQTPGVANTEFSITHNLNRVPTGFRVASIDQAGIVYKSVTAWTTTQIFLKCNVASANVVIEVY